ncbi:MAG: hypothetical protein ACC628_05260 [Pirellulaceae bacterium]
MSARFVRGSEIYIAFRRLEDRIAHTLGLRHGGIDRPLLTSLERTGEESWPSSPPLQQVSVESLPDGRRAAFLVGMAGRSHWSLSIAEGACGQDWLFDVACRVQQNPVWLGSSYHALVPIRDANHSTAVLEADPVAVRISVESIPGAPATNLRIHEDQLTVVQEGDNRCPPATFRWKYRVGPVKMDCSSPDLRTVRGAESRDPIQVLKRPLSPSIRNPQSEMNRLSRLDFAGGRGENRRFSTRISFFKGAAKSNGL